VILSSNLI